MTIGKYVGRRMTETLKVCHLCAHFGCFAFFSHREAMKINHEVAKDTKNLLVLCIRSTCHTIVTWKISCFLYTLGLSTKRHL
jgi:hypothetical protein